MDTEAPGAVLLFCFAKGGSGLRWSVIALQVAAFSCISIRISGMHACVCLFICRPEVDVGCLPQLF